jgi:hypothetical protein
MVNLLWFGQRDRHAGGATNGPITQAAAEAAVPAAALLVHWIATGTLRKLPDQPKRRRKSATP